MNASKQTNQELFLVVEGLTRQLASLIGRLAPLTKASEMSHLLGVDALYRSDKDLLLLCLRHDDKLTATGRRRLTRLACKGRIPVLDPMRLSADDKTLFYQHHLSRYSVRIDDKKSPDAALDALALLLGLKDERRRAAIDVSFDADEEETTVERAAPHRRVGPTPTVGSRPIVGRKPTEMSSARAAGKRRKSARMPTIPARPANRAPSPEDLHFRSAPTSRAPSQSEEGLQIRFERGDLWMPARLRNLTLKQIRLAAGAAPPLGSTVRVSIKLSELKTMLVGVVVEVINTETSVDGSTSFKVEIRDAQSEHTSGLIAILRRARAEGLELSPPPPRKNRRFSVAWPIAVMGDGHQFNGAALDVSARGLFVSTTHQIRDRKVVFGIPLDTNDATVQGRARIAREVSEEMAEEQNLNRGYGLQIETLSRRDFVRYENFLARVRLRSQLHVLVASQSPKGKALAACFQSAGYVVSQTTVVASAITSLDPYVVWDKGRPDVAVLDEDDLGSGLRTHVESNLEAHGIPMLRLQGQVPASARQALDQVMSV